MTLPEIKLRMSKLKALIEKANHDYYDLNQPTAGDRDYDMWERELLELEEKYPELADVDSPVRKVSGSSSDGFVKVTHNPPMQSLDKTHSFDELRDFDSFINKSISGFTYMVEPKVDGISLSLRYSNGVLIRAATRGNGMVGDDITANVRTIKTIPQVLPPNAPRELEVRGEAYMTRDGFVALNEKMAVEGKEEFANPRNACAGSLKQLDWHITAERPIDVVIYNAGGVGCEGFSSHSEMIGAFSDWGFPVVPWSRQAKTIDEVFSAIDELNTLRHTFRFEIDGAVIKVDERKFYSQLGATAHGPRWARAYKYAPERAETTVESIIVQVGRTGILTPVAELTPTEIAGSVVSRATLHNADQIARQDVRIGDKVWLVKAGDVIPAIDSVIVEKRTGREKIFVMPERCPVCGGNVRRNEGEVAFRCINPACPAQLCRRLEHFASRNALNLKALGGKIADVFVEKGVIRDLLDVFTLDYKELAELDVGTEEESVNSAPTDLFSFAKAKTARKFGKNAENLHRAVEDAKKMPLSRWLYAIGIPNVGVTVAKDIAAEHTRLSELKNSAVLNGVIENNERKGKDRAILKIKVEAAKAVLDFFNSEYGTKFISRMAEIGIDPEEPKSQSVKVEGPLVGMGCVLTGTLSLPREEYARLIALAGGVVQSAVTRKTRYLIAGENTGATKTEKARSLGTEVIDEARLRELLEMEPI